MYQGGVDVDTLNAVKSLLADASSVSPLSEQRVFTAEKKKKNTTGPNTV